MIVKNAFENKFAHDTELQFKVESRRNKLIALWAADLLGKNSDEAEKLRRRSNKI